MMNRTTQRLHHLVCFSFMLLAVFLIKTDIVVCAVPTLDWSGEEGLWNDGVHPDYGIKSGAGSNTFTFQVSYQDANNHPPLSAYPKVHIKRGGSDIPSSPFTLTEVDSGDTNYEDGKLYYYSTTLSPAGNDYTYSFVAYDSYSEEAYGSPANDHTLTVVTEYVWVDADFTGTSDGSEAYPYKTIADGISNAVSGQTVRVRPRDGSPYEYQETFSMKSGVDLVSDNDNSGDVETTYDDPYTDYNTSILTRTDRTVIRGIVTFPNAITADVVLDGFTVYTNAGGNTVMDIQGKSPIVRNNNVYWDSSTSGTYILKMDAPTSGTHEPIIENNLFHRVKTRGIGIGTYTSPLIQDNEIWDTATYPGIGINRKGVPGGWITIRHNHIFDCGGPGIGSTSLAKSLPYTPPADPPPAAVTIQGNSIHDNGFDSTIAGKPLGAGISLTRAGSPGTDLERLEIIIGGPKPGQGNQIYNSTLAGIILDSNGSGIFPILIQNNDIYDNDKAGIVLIDAGFQYDPPGPTPPNDPIIAEVLDNMIYGHEGNAGINIGGATYADIAYNAIYDNYAGIAFNMGSLEVDPGGPSSGTVNIEENDIYSNTMDGIAVRDAITNDVTIAGNDIYQNERGGIGIINSCENLVINRNEIHDNIRGGIHTGTDVADDYFFDPEFPDYEGFIGEPDTALLTVTQNKVHNNGLNTYGGGIDIRHASGTIKNNLIYENRKCGIRFGDYISEIVNNTVADNGHVVSDTEKYGGGIIYDDLDGAVNSIPSGDGPLIPIRNNIVAFHPSTGIRTGEYGGVCPSGEYRDYNLLYGNNNTPIDITPLPWFPFYRLPQLGKCWWNDHEIFADPEFVDRNNDDYHLAISPITSPAIDAGDTTLGDDVSVPPGEGTTDVDIGAYGGPLGIDW